jgi:hypothetical protein
LNTTGLEKNITTVKNIETAHHIQIDNMAQNIDIITICKSALENYLM